ncbi:hypothetical protein [Cohnella silvisoli]|uniref:Uncharacterized protein n=1 Tax=Cohnella silvisoli TaxID=2873699 RepID=A0ABV1KTM1_9BACL|nr:hypothetical protein [Cohnella silvisoli]MCD9022943.1 hypothetical protein [Cohnella silvisoli]
MSISKDILDQSFKGKSIVELDDLVHLIEDHFGYRVQLTRKDEESSLTDEQKKKLTSIIFKDPDVIYQLSQAEKDRQKGISTYSDNEEEFAKLLTEIAHDN